LLILASEAPAARPSPLSAAILVRKIFFSILQIHVKGTKLCWSSRFPFGAVENVGSTFPRLLNSKVEQKEDTGGHPPFSVIFLAQEKE
ncbi:hypothetical protein N302_12986, partial [Corvus brachyrhynchos]